MAYYTPDEWRSKQITAIDPYFWTESNEAKKITRTITLGNDYILGENSFLVFKEDDTHLRITPGHAIKQDVYINIKDNIILDIFEIRNYIIPYHGIISQPGIYYLVLDYQYAKTKPAPYAQIKIAKRYETLLLEQDITDIDDNYTYTLRRYLFIGLFEVIDDGNGNLIIKDIIPTQDPNHPELKKQIIDLIKVSNIIRNFSLYSMKDSLVIENINPDKSKVWINRGYIVVGNKKYIPIIEQEIGPFPPVDFEYNVRYDLVTVDKDGNIHIIYGKEEYDINKPFFEYIDYIPADQILLAIVRVKELEKAEILDMDSDIFNIRDFQHLHNLITIGEDLVENSCKVYPNTPPNNKINIAPGMYVSADNNTFIFFEGEKNIEIQPMIDPNKYRYDLFCLDSNGVLKVLHSQEYIEEQNLRSLDFDYGGMLSLAIIKVHGDELVISDEEIIDVRPYLNGTGATYDQVVNFERSNIRDCRIEPTSPVSNRVVSIYGGSYISSNGKYIVNIPENTISETFDRVSESGLFRFDLLVGNDNGELEIIKGEETTYDNPYKMAPNFPDDKKVLAIIRINENEDVYIEDHDIFDARPFMGYSGYNYAARGIVNYKIYKSNVPYFFIYDFIFINPANGVRPMLFRKDNTPTFAPVLEEGYTRYDLVTVDSNSQLQIIQGSEFQAYPGETPFERCPNIPSDKIALFIVKIDETENVNITEEDVTCIAEYINKGQPIDVNNPLYPPTIIPSFFEHKIWYLDNNSTSWILVNGKIDLTKPYLIIRDGVSVDIGRGIDTIINGNEIYFDAPPKYFTLIFQILSDNPANDGVNYSKKDDWDGTQNVWDTGNQNINSTVSKFILRDGIFLEENFGYTLNVNSNGVIIYDDLIEKSSLYLLFMDDTKFNHDMKIDWDIEPEDMNEWDINFNINLNKPYLVIKDGIVLFNNIGFTINEENNKIIFDEKPKYFSKVLNLL